MSDKLRDFRFIANGEGNPNEGGARKIVELANSAKDAGFDTFAIPDHFGQTVAPFSALGALAASTEGIRLATNLLNIAWRHPAVIAKEANTIDLLSKGRLELGIGLQYTQEDLDKLTWQPEPIPERAEKIAEALQILDPLMRGQNATFKGKYFSADDLIGYPRPRQAPRPPIGVTAGDKEMLQVAAKYADIISVITSTTDSGKFRLSDMTMAKTKERVDIIRQSAGERFADIELNWTLVAVMYSEDREATADIALKAIEKGFQENIEVDTKLTISDILESPYLAIGTFAEIAEHITKIRKETTMSYVGVFPGQIEAMEPVISILKNQ